MPRPKLQISDRLPYHVTARTNNRVKFKLGLERMWELMGSEVRLMDMKFGIETHAFVLMPNHLHWILTTPHFDLGKVMQHFMKTVADQVNLRLGNSGHVFGGACHRSLIQSTRYYGHALKYVYRNPVKSRICDRVQTYPYSTLNGLIGQNRLPFPIYFTRMGMEISLPGDQPSELLDWLNTPFPKEAETLIQKGLKKAVFDSLISRKTRRPHEILMTRI